MFKGIIARLTPNYNNNKRVREGGNNNSRELRLVFDWDVSSLTRTAWGVEGRKAAAAPPSPISLVMNVKW